MNNSVPTVTLLINQIKRNLEGAFQNISVMGEISNLSSSSSGHWYLSLSDNDSLLSSALFKMDAMRNPVIRNIKDGDKVICSGSISVYPKRGTFQLIIKRITPVGKGDLKEQFELLKRKLAADGLFDIEHKKKIPDLPKRIAVITAQGAAALQDFLNIIDRRSSFCDILISPALVQGQAAPGSIRKALEKIIKYDLKNREEGRVDKTIDVIVLTRGGGSMEDLWAFNDEALAWDIYNCPIPIISAVGHQVDFTISDFVSDFRAETPSAAAEILTNRQHNLKEELSNLRKHLISATNTKVKNYTYSLSNNSPSKILDKIWKKIALYQTKVENGNVIKRKIELLALSNYTYELDILLESFKKHFKQNVNNLLTRLNANNEMLKVLNPKNILTRGYVYTQVNDDVITSKKDFQKLANHSKLKLIYHDGEVLVEKVSDV